MLKSSVEGRGKESRNSNGCRGEKQTLLLNRGGELARVVESGGKGGFGAPFICRERNERSTSQRKRGGVRGATD